MEHNEGNTFTNDIKRRSELSDQRAGGDLTITMTNTSHTRRGLRSVMIMDWETTSTGRVVSDKQEEGEWTRN